MNILDITFDANYFNDFIMVGLLKIFAIIAVLQLVKKLPEIINTIFGTHIQSRGGIKGRLGEMAGVGGIAQKAWTSLGRGAKNLAKLGLTAVPAALGAGANLAYKQKTGKNLTDLKAVRGIRAAGKGIGTALKSGSWLKGYEEGKTTFDKVSNDPRDKANFMKKVNGKTKDILTDGGSEEKSAIQDENMERKKATEKKFDDWTASVGGKEVDEAAAKRKKAARTKRFAEQIVKDNDTIAENLRKAMGAYEVGSKEANALKAMADDIDKYGKHKEILVKIKAQPELFEFEGGQEILDTLAGKNGVLHSKERRLRYINANKDELFDFSDKDIENLGRGNNAVNFVAKTAKENDEQAQKNFEITLAGSNLSEIDKYEINTAMSSNIDLVNSEAYAVGRVTAENGMDIEYNAGPWDESSIYYKIPSGGPAPSGGSDSSSGPAPSEGPAPSGGSDSSSGPAPSGGSDSSSGPAPTSGPVPSEGSESSGGATIINNYYGNSGAAGSAEDGEKGKGNEQSVKVDTKDMEEKIQEMGEKVSNTITNEGNSTRTTITQQANQVKTSTDAVKNAIDGLTDSLNKPPKNE